MSDQQTACAIVQLVLEFIWSRSGLILNFIGSLLIAFSFGKNIADAHQEDSKGRRIYLASFLRPRMFKVGMLLLIIGFLLSIICNQFHSDT